MKLLNVLFLLIFVVTTQVSSRDRLVLRLPKIEDYQILKCDFHTHTVFSDGHVWPDFRVGEAWIDGLDVLAITDHIEYQPHEKDVPTNHNRPFDIAKSAAASVGITLVKGTEITRDMPPGHFNALFLKNIELLDTDNWRDAIKAAHEQGAFIFWNHPGWTGQEPDGVGKWYDEHEELYQAGMMHGIEVVNDDEYYPEVHQWCLDKKLTMIGNSDIHSTTDMQFNLDAPKHRPMTWVLATDKSPEAIREALDAQRTVVYWRDWLIGEQQYLEPIFHGSVELITPQIDRRARQFVQLANTSDLTFELELIKATEGISAPQNIILQPGHAARLRIDFDREKAFENFELEYQVVNLKIAPEKGLPVVWDIDVK